MVPTSIPLEKKKELFNRLVRCGYERLELTSFVHPKWVPQFKDAAEFLGAVVPTAQSKLEFMAFVPNVKGLERLLAFEVPWVSTFVAISETFNQKNVNQSIDESIGVLREIVQLAHHKQRKVRIYISTAFGCPYEGAVDSTKRSEWLKKVADLGPDEIALSDTIGVGTPIEVTEVTSQFKEIFDLDKTAYHFHDTYGLALANAQAAYDSGVRRFDGSTGGIGGCPYAKGATGNVASESLQYLFARQQQCEFRRPEILEVLKYLKQDLGLEVNSSLNNIVERGGKIYGVK